MEGGACRQGVPLDTLYVPAVEQIIGGLEFFGRRPPSRPPSEGPRCQELLSECRAIAQENEERSARGAQRARAALISASYGLPEQQALSCGERPAQRGLANEAATPRRQRSISATRAMQAAPVDALAARGAREVEVAVVPRLAIPADASTTVPSTRTWTSASHREASAAAAAPAPPPAAPMDMFANMAAANAANAPPPVGQPLGIAFKAAQPWMPAGAAVGPAHESRIGTAYALPASGVSPIPGHGTPTTWAWAPPANPANIDVRQSAPPLPVGACQLRQCRSVSPMPQRAASAAPPPEPRPVPAFNNAPVLHTPRSAAGTMSPVTPCAGLPFARPLQAPDIRVAPGIQSIVAPAASASRTLLPAGFQGCEHGTASPRLPSPAPQPVQVQVVGSRSPMPPPLGAVVQARPMVSPPREMSVDVANYVSHALRRQATRQILSCLKVAANRHVGCAFRRWGNAASAAQSVTSDGCGAVSSARAAKRDHSLGRNDRLHSVLASAETLEGRKVALHERNLAVLLGLRQLHSCLQKANHRRLRSAFGQLKFQTASFMPDGGHCKASLGGNFLMAARQASLDSDQVPSASSNDVVPLMSRSPLLHAPISASMPSRSSTLWDYAQSPESVQLPPPQVLPSPRLQGVQSVPNVDMEATRPCVPLIDPLSLAKQREAAPAPDASSSTDKRPARAYSEASSSLGSSQTLPHAGTPRGKPYPAVPELRAPEGLAGLAAKSPLCQDASSGPLGSAQRASLAAWLSAPSLPTAGAECGGLAAHAAEEASFPSAARRGSGASLGRADGDGAAVAEEYSFATKARHHSLQTSSPLLMPADATWPSRGTPRSASAPRVPPVAEAWQARWEASAYT